MDEICDDCQQPYTIWYADNDLWNAVMPSTAGMLCARCFLIRAEPVTEIARITWAETPSRRDRERGYIPLPNSRTAREQQEKDMTYSEECLHPDTLHECNNKCSAFWCRVSRKEKFDIIEETMEIGDKNARSD